MSDSPAVSALVVIWEYCVSPGRERDFAEMYGPGGDWAKLFGEAPGYIRTDLTIDRQDPARALILDWWQTREAYESFLREYKSEYEELNARAEMFHSSEICLGWFIRDDHGPTQES